MDYLTIKNRLIALPPEKKNLLYLTALLLAIFIYIMLIWYPLYASIESLKDENHDKQTLLTWMRQAGNEIKELRKINTPPKKLENISLLTLIDQEAKKNTWALSALEMKQIDNAQVQVSFSRIAFDNLMSGLEDLWKKYKIEVVKMDVQRTEETNMVSTNMILKI